MTAVPMSEVELAHAIEQCTGLDAAAYAAERIEALARAEDAAGVQRFKSVAAQLERLRSRDDEAPPKAN